MDILTSYDAAAKAYTEHLKDELEGKPLDRHLLNRFAEATRGRGMVLDLGCGPGHIAAYLKNLGVATAGVDLSPGMVREARALNPDLDFQVGDMTRLQVPDAAVAGLVAFYAIVHLAGPELEPAFREFSRVMVPGGFLLAAFHVGDQVVHADELFGQSVSLDFVFHRPDMVMAALRAAGLQVMEKTEREPYEGVEYPSRRCYLLAKRLS
jgi:SAM-dependent methyltransferase